jgi:hypothetical protein
MTILAGDIKLVASQTMDDVPEGGGSPTGTVIADGVSNALFPDISELDRAGGRVSLRKVHVHVQTDDRDTFLGSNMIVAEPPADPKVSITLFTNDSTFDRRTEAASRVESYLNKGPQWPGILYENHISGQRSIQLLQEVKTELPTVGHTLVLVQNEGLTNEFLQYVRTTAVSSALRTGYDDQGVPFEKAVVTLSISDALRYDMKGSPMSKYLTKVVGCALVRDTVVADAGTYVGVTPLVAAADIGGFTVNATSIYSQLVPSAQTETPISDVRANGLSTALVATGGTVVNTVSMAFTTGQNLYLGGPVYPGSLSIVRSGVTLTDSAGLLISADAEVGQVDYDNGIASLSTNVWGTGGGTHTVTFRPAAVPDLISDQSAIRVTVESRSLSYAYTLARPPLPRTVSIAYLAQGRWYTLRDDGAGVLSGASSSHGIGTVNYTTGSISVTLGALPDVGGALVTQSYSDLSTVVANNSILQSSNAYIAFNTNGVQGEEKGAVAIPRLRLVVNWDVGGTTKYVRDENGNGTLTGDGVGTVDYSSGVIRISPTTLPPSGTVFTAGLTGVTPPFIVPAVVNGGFTPAPREGAIVESIYGLKTSS